jgi:hypothetical protein
MKRVTFEPFAVFDLYTMVVQDRHADLVYDIKERETDYRARLEGPYSWTAWSVYGMPIASCGILEDGGTWAFLAKNLRREMVAISRYVRWVLDKACAANLVPYAEIDESYAEAVRWVELLGFHRTNEYPPECELTLWEYRG